METTIVSSQLQLFTTNYFKISGNDIMHREKFCHRPIPGLFPLKINCSRFGGKPLLLLDRQNIRPSYDIVSKLRGRCFEIKAASTESLGYEQFLPEPNAGEVVLPLHDSGGNDSLRPRPKAYKNRFLNFVHLSSVLNTAAESFFKSEIRRRLFVTAILIVISRVGYFIPLPGFDRRLMPQDYLSFVSGSVDELGDSTPELKLSLFQLGISPQIAASILMQVLCHVVPSLVKLRKEGLDGHEKIKSYIWWISLGFAIVEALVLSCYSLSYSIYAASYRVKHVMLTSSLLVCGAMTMTWICDKITDAGFGIAWNSQLSAFPQLFTAVVSACCRELTAFFIF